MNKIEVGDSIGFRAATRWSDRAVWRKVVDFDDLGRPLVRFGGWRDFAVRQSEIINVRHQEAGSVEGE